MSWIEGIFIDMVHNIHIHGFYYLILAVPECSLFDIKRLLLPILQMGIAKLTG